MNQYYKVILVLLFITGQGHAVHLSQNGTGEVLILPYYTVNNGFDTLLTITNTKNVAKAVRVRFREAANNREVFEFNLYLGKMDIWTGGLVKDQVGNTVIISHDKSCTIPTFTNGNLNFSSAKYTGDMSDGYGDELKRLNEGFVEIIEMGEVTGNSALALEITQESNADCSTIENAWLTSGYWLNDATIDMQPLSGGLIADAILINVAKGISISEKATIFSDFSDEILHYNINNDSPNLADSKTTSTVIDKKGFKHELHWQTGFEALSSVISKSQISNEYVTSAGIGAKTNWVLTMPTKQYYTDPVYSTTMNTSPFNENFISELGIACHEIIGSAYSRESEESSLKPYSFPIDPPPPPPPESFYNNGLCWSTNTVSFTHEPKFETLWRYTEATRVFIANYSNHVGIFASNFSVMNGFKGPAVLASNFDNGTANIEFPQSTSRNINAQGNPVEVTGLPIIGFSTNQFINGNLQDNVLANYAGIFNHKYKTEVINPDVDTNGFGPMQLSQDGVGQVLLFPYYTVRNGMNTLISVANATADAKALRIVFTEGEKSVETFALNVYLAPHDAWTAGLVPHVIREGDIVNSDSFVGSNGLKLITFDTSCTLPVVVDERVFSLYGFDANPKDVDIERTQQGMIQVIDMGTLTNESAQAVSTNQGIPNDCSYLLDDAQTYINPLLTIQAPTGEGGIYGAVSLINVAQGVDMSYDAVAINNFNNINTHQLPSLSPPNLASAQSRTLIETGEGLIQSTWANGVEAVSALLMHENVINDFTIENSIHAQTELVWSFPTRNYYQNDPNLSNHQFFNNRFALDVYNREQSVISTINPDTIYVNGTGYEIGSFEYDINVSIIGDNIDSNNTIFDSHNRLIDGYDYCDTVNYPCVPVDPGFRYLSFSNGWFDMSNTSRPTPTSGDIVVDFGFLTGVGENGEIHKLYGIPSIGFVAQQYKNGILNGGSTLANYALIKMNKYSKPRLEIIE